MGAYFYTIEVKNMPSRNPKVGSSTKERFIHLNLMILADAREIERMRASLKLGPSFLIHAETSKGENFAIGKP